jgi:hypothetical protein
MTVPTNTFQTYQSIGNREDLIDVITNISPKETWFTTNTANDRATAIRHEWQTDALAAAGANAQVEGDDFGAAAVVPTSRLANSCQILTKVFQLSETQQAIMTAGRSNELDYQTMKFSAELAKDIEYALIINASEVTGTAAVARQLKGALGWIATNVTTASATTVDLTETVYNDNLGLIWAQGGNPSYTLVGAYQKRKISGFTTNTRNVNADEKKLVSAVSIYESDFGIIQVRLHHVMNATAPGSILNLGELDLWHKAWLRPVKRLELAKTGSSDKWKIEAELTLESRQEKGSGKMTGFKSA